MRLCKPSYEIWEQPAGLEGIYKMIEKAGRICYSSSDKITEDSAKSFVDRMVKSGHGAMLEHGTVYLAIPYELEEYEPLTIEKYVSDPYTHVVGKEYTYYVTSNYRVLVENNWLDDLKYLCEPTEYHVKRITVKFILSRSIAQEYTRHRVFSFAMESQRYCNYSKDKFDNEVTFIQPCWNCTKTAIYNGVDNFDGDYFEHSLREAEAYYFKLLEQGWKPQQAREVLPNACKTELVMTGFADDWKHFFFLRCPVNAHPQARELAIPLSDEFNRRGYLK